MSKLLGNELFGENIKKIRLSCGLTQDQTVAKLQLLGSLYKQSTVAVATVLFIGYHINYFEVRDGGISLKNSS